MWGGVEGGRESLCFCELLLKRSNELVFLSLSLEGEDLDLVFFDLESGLAHSKVMGKLCSDEEKEKGED